MRNGVDVEHALRFIMAVTVKNNLVVELAGETTGASVSDAVHRGNGHQDGVALLGIDEEPLISIGVSACDVRGVDAFSVAEDAVDDGSVLSDPA